MKWADSGGPFDSSFYYFNSNIPSNYYLRFMYLSSLTIDDRDLTVTNKNNSVVLYNGSLGTSTSEDPRYQRPALFMIRHYGKYYNAE